MKNLLFNIILMGGAILSLVSFLSCGEMEEPFIRETSSDDAKLFAGRYTLVLIDTGNVILSGKNWNGSLVLQDTLYGIWKLRLEVLDPSYQTELEFSGGDWFAFSLDNGSYWIDLKGICNNAIARWGTKHPNALYLEISKNSAEGLLKEFLDTLGFGDTYIFVWLKMD